MVRFDRDFPCNTTLWRPSHQPATSTDKDLMEKGNMEKGNMEKGNMEKGNMEKGNMEKGNMEKGNMEKGNMEKGNMEKGNMEKGSMEKGNMEKCVFGEDCVTCLGHTRSREDISKCLKTEYCHQNASTVQHQTSTFVLGSLQCYNKFFSALSELLSNISGSLYHLTEKTMNGSSFSHRKMPLRSRCSQRTQLKNILIPAVQ